ncbi:MAG: helix-turn-helix transcriptional regulator [Spirochaetales bacterium]|nr:helix-turn-helix transcriptional regulator [Spirochaetales bacterium]
MGTFSERLREEIDYLGLTRKELAYKANVKIRALDMYIGSQGSMPPADVAVRLAKALNVTVEYLVTGEKTKSDNVHSENSQIEKDLSRISETTRHFLEKAVHLFAENET